MPDTTPAAVDATSRDYGAIRATLLRNAQTPGSPGYFPGWAGAANGGDPNDAGVALVEMLATVGDVLNHYVDRGAQEAHLATLQLRSSALYVAQMLGYRPTPLTPATVTLSFTVQGPTTGSLGVLTIPRGTQVATVEVPDVCAAVVFETDADLVVQRVTGGLRVGTVTATQGRTTTAEPLGTATGTATQYATLAQLQVLGGSVVAGVDEGAGPVPWTFVENLAGSGPQDNVFTTLELESGATVVLFGDGVYGRVPPAGAALSATYRTGVGAQGNVGPNAITVLLSQFSDSGFVVPQANGFNPAAATGGADPEPVASIRRNAPQVKSAAERCVTAADFAAVALQVAGVASSAATAATYRNVFVYVAPLADGQPDPSVVARVQALLAARSPIGTRVTVLGPTYVPLTITAAVTAAPSYNRNAVRVAAVTAVQNLFTPAASYFGQAVQGSDVYAALLAVPGVQAANVSVLTRTANPSATVGVTCAVGEIPRLTSGLMLTASGGVTAVTGGSAGSPFGAGDGKTPAPTSAPTVATSCTGAGGFQMTVSWVPGSTAGTAFGTPTAFAVLLDFYKNGTYYQSQEFGRYTGNSVTINGTQNSADQVRVTVRAYDGEIFNDSAPTTTTYSCSA